MKRIDLRLPFGPALTPEQFGMALGLSGRLVRAEISAGAIRAERIPPKHVHYRIPWAECRRYAILLHLIPPDAGVRVLRYAENPEQPTSVPC